MKKIIYLLIFINITPILAQKLHCSAFVLNQKNLLLAKNLDWVLGNGIIIFNPKNKVKVGIYNKSTKSKWISKYSSITFNLFGLNQPLGGMNEKGLTIEELSTWPVDYPQTNDSLILSEFEWIQFQLDNFSSTKEVIENSNIFSISKFYFDLHFLLTDRKGETAIIEFINGEIKIYSNDLIIDRVLTNNNYSELKRYKKLVTKVPIKNLDVNNSQDRFLKICKMLNRTSSQNSDHSATMNILDSVRVADTQWSIIYDITDQIIYYKTLTNRSLRIIEYDKNIINQKDYLYIPIESNLQSGFKVFNSQKNDKHLNQLKTDILKVSDDSKSKLIKLINKHLMRYVIK